MTQSPSQLRISAFLLPLLLQPPSSRPDADPPDLPQQSPPPAAPSHGPGSSAGLTITSQSRSFQPPLPRALARGPFVLAVPVPILEMAKLTLADLDRKTAFWKDVAGAASSRKAQNQTEAARSVHTWNRAPLWPHARPRCNRSWRRCRGPLYSPYAWLRIYIYFKI